MPEFAFPYKEFKSLDVHKKLSLVIIGTTGIDGAITDFRFERIRFPKFKRLYRLHVIVAIYKNCLEGRIYDAASENNRMTFSRTHLSTVSTRLQQQLAKPFSTPEHIRAMNFLAAD